ncbi:hypothetical protein GCM10010140_62850 [Streptosporangium pseudovulgare]|uniref:Uncharacterized protein n=1 Tax=Streptosporangium pseudovulgare TaxID=35765 RepID=A0ABQ2RDT1_9ACTN|nr:hypothetical protein GCM10010140_62850 [Streptosporangium pseudovulgare]
MDRPGPSATTRTPRAVFPAPARAGADRMPDPASVIVFPAPARAGGTSTGRPEPGGRTGRDRTPGPGPARFANPGDPVPPARTGPVRGIRSVRLRARISRERRPVKPRREGVPLDSRWPPQR